MSVSSFGDWLGLLATTALAAELADGYTAANFALGGVLVVRLLPAVVFGPLAGAFADRFDRRKMMVVADLTRFVLFASIPLVGDAVVAVRRVVPDRVRQPVLDPGQGRRPSPTWSAATSWRPANQVSLVTTYGITPVLAAAVFSLLALLTRVLADSVDFFDANRVDLALYINAADLPGRPR